ncbi:hypothetical protein ANMWB30_44010 [Arthrobacter sp. MWB30]|nr:hypothetical protein ANMWB30_44010 [Arthrobacter sp. MWB30]
MVQPYRRNGRRLPVALGMGPRNPGEMDECGSAGLPAELEK